MLLHRHKPGSIVKLDRYLHERTDGAIGGLSQLIRGATSEAIISGSKAITRKTQEAIKLVSLGPVQGEMLGSHLRRLAIVEQPSRIRTRRAHRTLATRVLAAQQHHGPLNGTAPSGPRPHWPAAGTARQGSPGSPESRRLPQPGPGERRVGIIGRRCRSCRVRSSPKAPIVIALNLGH
ncbi:MULTISPECIES: hypothetical protein [unclassified Streptomyces]|uniref:hypothetical protein n=1 Tax=unclassified Streptomyces TaxID=2593676 RepID=UPI003804AFCD